MPGKGDGIEAGNVSLEYLLRPCNVPDVFLIVDLFCVEKIIFLEPSDLEGRIKKIRDSRAEHDLLFDETEFQKGEDGETDDDGDDGVIPEGDLLPDARSEFQHGLFYHEILQKATDGSSVVTGGAVGNG